MARKHRGGLSRGERKIQIALADRDRAMADAQLASEILEEIRAKTKCTHPIPYRAAYICFLCGQALEREVQK